MSAGYSGTPLAKKLGVKAGGDIALLHVPDGVGDILNEIGQDANIRTTLKPPETLAVLFCSSQAALKMRLPQAARQLHADGALWISWPKKSSALFKDLTEDGVRAVALPMGLVDVKVCAMNTDWSGLKLMVRKELRQDWNR